MSRPPLLLLWDIDGTLLQRASAEHGRALREAAARVHGLDSLDGVTAEYAGRTDAAILRDLLRIAGVPDDAIDARARGGAQRFRGGVRAALPVDLSRFVAPGVPDVLEALRRGRARSARRCSPATSSRSGG